MQYKILDGQGNDLNKVLDNLMHEVRKHCYNGWKPQGGVSVTVTKYDYVYACQAMVKES